MIITILILLALAAPASANTLTWVDNSVVEDGFIIEMMTKGTWAEVGRTAANTTTYSDSNTEGVYRVRAYMKNPDGDRKSTRLNSSHSSISYAVFCLKKKKNKKTSAQCKEQT